MLLKTPRQYTLLSGERAVLYRLRTMTEAEFEALPFGSEDFGESSCTPPDRRPA